MRIKQLILVAGCAFSLSAAAGTMGDVAQYNKSWSLI